MKTIVVALRVTAFTLVLTGIVYPLVVTGIAHALFHHAAQGSLVVDEKGQAIGSELIGQPFAQPAYFHPRPSAAGNGYDATASSGTNLGVTSDKLRNGVPDDPKTKDVDETFLGVKQLAAAYRAENGLADGAPVPADAVTRSASGLDPHITPENALLQVARVAGARGVAPERMRVLVEANVDGRDLGFLGEPRVNVLLLNLALDRKFGAPAR